MPDTLKADFRYALRQVKKHSGSALAAFVVLAAGIGTTAAMFTIVSGVLLRPLPVKNAEQIVQVDEINTRTGENLKVSMTDFVDWKARLKSFSTMALYRVSQGNLTGTGSPERVRILECDTSFLPLLGISPLRGRSFSKDQTQPNRASEALLTFSFWQSEFGGQDVIGRQIVIDEKPYTVIGVLPDLLSIFGEEHVWVPLEMDLGKRENSRGYHWYFALGRLRPGVTIHQANRELRTLAASLAAEYPSRNEGVSADAEDFRRAIAGDYRRPLLLLFGFVAVVLLIACVNVASLALARASSRGREMSIRVALGATRLQLFSQVLTESLVLSCAAGCAGIALALTLVRTIGRLPVLNIPLAQNIQIDWRVLLFTGGVGLLTGIGFGLAPALRASFVQASEALKQSSRGNTDSRAQRNLKRSFVVVQSAFASVLLVISGLLLISFVNASRIDPGFNVHRLLTLHISLPPSRLDYDHPGRVGVFVRKVLDRIRAIPGVKQAAIASDLPLTALGGGAGVLVEGRPRPTSAFSAPYAQWTLVSPGYFRALNVPLLRGREFDERDRQNTGGVTIVNEAFVKHFLNGHAAVGKRIALASNPSEYLQIVGVVGNVQQLGIEKEAIPQVFLSLNQLEDSWLAIAVRTEGDPIPYVARIRSAVQNVDPGIAVFLPRTMEQIISRERGWRVFETSLVTAFAAVAILLAAVGTYAVISCSVAQRTAEIGIRIALGATGNDILRSFALEGALPAVLGAAMGLAIGFAVARLSSTLLYGVTAANPISYAATVFILVITAVAASYMPARRAAFLDFSRALRYE